MYGFKTGPSGPGIFLKGIIKMKYIGKNKFELNNGTEIEAYQGIIGLSTIDGFGLYSGYDDPLGYGRHNGGNYEDLTDEEEKEIADFMIQKWTEFRNSL